MAKSALLRLISGICAAFFVAGLITPAAAIATPRIKPPAPGPVYLSLADHARLTMTAEALKKKRYSQAQSATVAISDPIAKSLGEWLYFSAEDPLVNIIEADRFLGAHLGWPAISRIQTHVEKRMPNNAPPQTVLDFFDTRDPVTGDGKVQLARALFATGETEAGEIYLHDAWVNNNFSAANERAILSSYHHRLSKEDHAARVDRLLWSRQVTNARRIFPRLSAKDRRMAETRAALLLGASSAAATYRNLAEAERLDSGVLLAAVRYFRRRGDEHYAISLAAQSPKDPEILRNSSRWWHERQLLMRWALKNGRFADAYAAASNHGLEAGGDFAEAEFNAGWIALRFLNEPARAETHFLALASAVGTPISLSRAYYWLGRAAEARGISDLADAHYGAAAQYTYAYYGQLAAEKTGGPALQSKFAPALAATPHDKSLFTSRPSVAALRMLADLDLDYAFMVFAYHVDDQLETPGEYVELAKILTREGAPHLSVRAGKVAVRREAFAPEVAYPLIFIPDEAKRYVAPEIILGLSRQESEFNPRAYSRAGARGVMQLIPSTAKITARKAGLRYSRSALLDDPIYNMTIGSAHLSHLLDRFDGSLIMTFAAYNAGAGRVNQWVEAYGDPRGPGVDPMDWVELIPFAETRNYVQRVLENMQVYRGRLNDAPIPGQLLADLERGGASHRAARDEAPSATLVAAAASLGRQTLSPLPEQTRLRVKQFKMRGADPRVKPQSPGRDARDYSAGGEQAANTGTPARAASTPDAETPDVETIITRAPDIPSIKETKPADRVIGAAGAAGAAGATAPAQQTTAVKAPAHAPKPKAGPGEPAALKIFRPGEQAPNDLDADALNAGQLSPALAPATAAGQEELPAIYEDIDDDDYGEKGDGGDAAGTVNARGQEAPPGAETIGESGLSDAEMAASIIATETISMDGENGAMDPCLTYRDFLARAAEDDITAEDLNAGMRAELEGGGGVCN